MRASDEHRGGPGQRPQPLPSPSLSLARRLLVAAWLPYLGASVLGWTAILFGAGIPAPRLLGFGEAVVLLASGLLLLFLLGAVAASLPPRHFARNNQGGAGAAIALLIVLLFIGILFFELGGWLWVQNLFGIK